MSREAFESMIIDGGRYPNACEKGADGQYIKPGTLAVWLTWQAALAWAYEDAARFCETNCAGISYANGNQGPCLTEFPKECGGRHDGMTYAEAIRERAKEVTR